VWVNIPIDTLGWFKTPERISLKALEEELTTHNTITRLEELAQQASNHRLTQAQQNQLEIIDSETMRAKLAAEKWCWKLPVSAVQWCPQVTQAIARILYWKGIKKCQGGGHISAKYLICLAKKGGTHHNQEHQDKTKTQVTHNI